MKGPWLLLIVLVSVACSEPRQLGGLGIFNPNGARARLEQSETRASAPPRQK